MAKLYPPIISGTLPAFYTDGTVTKITVPFSMNKAVNTRNIRGFSLKIKTAYSNTYIATLENINNFNLTSNEVIFYWDNSDENLSKIKPGQFLKAQLAYINIDENDIKTIGYYSTVGVIKYTDKPILTINEFEFENNSNEDDFNKIRTFCSTCTGIYTPGEDDKSERPYQYQFLLLDENDKEVENSGWLLHNNELDIGDTYTFKSKMEVLTIYKVQYNVKTINNLNESVEYQCLIPEEKINNPLILNAENVYEEGYVNLFFSKKLNASLNNDDIPYVIDIYREEYGTNNQCFIYRVKIEDDNDLNWSFQDFTIEQGITYLYYFKYNKNGYHSQIYGEKKDGIEYPVQITADFEDMFLYDGQKQIKLRFNPKVSSFKINHLEQKTDVIGNRYPIFFRNNIVEYKEFPISGLISYHLDDNELFIQDSLQELGIQRNILERLGTNHDYDENSPFSTEQGKYFNSQSSSVKSLNLISNNIKAERLFKMKLLDWLGNGEIKLFKSPSEGNYLIRLMNISLSPEDKLNRMLHTFSCTAYEAKEFNFENLEELGFINIDQNIQIETINKNIYYLKKDVEFYPTVTSNSDQINSDEIYDGANQIIRKKWHAGFTSIENSDLQTVIKSNLFIKEKTAIEKQDSMTDEYIIEQLSNNFTTIYYYRNNDNKYVTYALYKDLNDNNETGSIKVKFITATDDWNNKSLYYYDVSNNQRKINTQFLTIDNINTIKGRPLALPPFVYLQGFYIVQVNPSTPLEVGD